jgi:hypothetical protein
VISPAPDSSWFYSSLSQVTAAIVGFFGGFFILRLLGYMSEWDDLRRRIDSLETGWFPRNVATEGGRLDPDVEDQVEIEEDRLWMDLVRALDERNRANMHPEMIWGGVLLAVLLGIGTVWPLIALGAPSNRQQWSFLVPWALALLGFGGVMYWRARLVLGDLKAFPLSQRTEREYDQYLLNREADEARIKEARKAAPSS